MVCTECFGVTSSSMFWSRTVSHTRAFSNPDAFMSSWKHHQSPSLGKWESGVCAQSYALTPASLCPHVPRPPSTELPPRRKSLHICPFLLCFGPRLPRMLQSPLSTFCLETSLLKALSSLGIFSSLQVTFGNNYTKCLAIAEHGHHFSISYNIFLIIF